jgi:hypothetical protein
VLRFTVAIIILFFGGGVLAAAEGIAPPPLRLTAFSSLFFRRSWAGDGFDGEDDVSAVSSSEETEEMPDADLTLFLRFIIVFLQLPERTQFSDLNE